MNLLEPNEWYPVTLPSKGKYYQEKMPGGQVQITPWTLAQEETILRFGEADPNMLLRQLMADNVKYPAGFSYEDLLSTDQYFLLVQLRCVSYVPWYTTQHACPFCQNVDQVQIDLTKLIVKVPDDMTSDQEPFSCFLPKKKKEVQLQFLRTRDELAAADYAARSPVKIPGAERKFTYARQLVSVGGQSLKFDEKMEFVAGLPVLDLEIMKEALNRRSTGITGRYPTTCSACGKEDATWSPMLHGNFFRPSQDDILRSTRGV